MSSASAERQIIVSDQYSIAVSSTVLSALTYDKSTQTLLIAFKSGRIYRYLGVPAQTVDDLLTAESKGRFFNASIRNRFEYQPVARGAGAGLQWTIGPSCL